MSRYKFRRFTAVDLRVGKKTSLVTDEYNAPFVCWNSLRWLITCRSLAQVMTMLSLGVHLAMVLTVVGRLKTTLYNNNLVDAQHSHTLSLS